MLLLNFICYWTLRYGGGIYSYFRVEVAVATL